MSGEGRKERAAKVRKLAVGGWLAWVLGTPLLASVGGTHPLTRALIVAGWVAVAALFIINLYYTVRILASGEWRYK